jgi:hypothetical protein
VHLLLPQITSNQSNIDFGHSLGLRAWAWAACMGLGAEAGLLTHAKREIGQKRAGTQPSSAMRRQEMCIEHVSGKTLLFLVYQNTRATPVVNAKLLTNFPGLRLGAVMFSEAHTDAAVGSKC